MNYEGILVKKIHDLAYIPTKAHPGDAGYDLYSVEDLIVPEGGTVKVPTGICIAPKISKFPSIGNERIYFRIANRSGMGSKGILVGGGVVDENYRGEVQVILINTSSTPYLVNVGDKIAQLIPEVYLNLPITEVRELDSTTRGASGFGSSGA